MTFLIVFSGRLLEEHSIFRLSEVWSPILWPSTFFFAQNTTTVQAIFVFFDQVDNSSAASENEYPGFPGFHPTVLGESAYSVNMFFLGLNKARFLILRFSIS